MQQQRYSDSQVVEEYWHMCLYHSTLLLFYGANSFYCFSQVDVVMLLYPCHSVLRAGKMKANLTVQDIDKRDLWHQHLISCLRFPAKDLDCKGGVCLAAVWCWSSSLPYTFPLLMSEFHANLFILVKVTV